MADIVLRAEGLSKQFRIGTRRERYKTAREAIVSAVTNSFDWARRRRTRAELGTVWALRDVSFDVPRGEVVGVIGPNGAGKSTLLKILSRITEPTHGFAEVKGRVGSLLEVGTGFHLELTGRENVYLNGAILGMRRQEVDRKFDEIVAFAEVERFLETPVKHYSTGMHLRLAFAVAAHFEPEVLLVDEVLAVGDAAFQRKCLGKMRNVAGAGRTVLFVSHNFGAVKELCDTTIVLHGGEVLFRGPVVAGLTRCGQLYSEKDSSVHSGGWDRIRIVSHDQDSLVTVDPGDPLSVQAGFVAEAEFRSGRFIFQLRDPLGNTLVHQRVQVAEVTNVPMRPGRYTVQVDVPAVWLAPGAYSTYFKFIGTEADGAEKRYVSDSAVLEVAGSSDGLSQAFLAPPRKWRVSLQQESPVEAVTVS